MDLSEITESITSDFLRYGSDVIKQKWFTRHTAMSGFFQWCLSRGYVSQMPLTMDKPKKPQHITPYIYSDVELRKLFSAAMTYQKRPLLTYPECVKAILQLTYVLGLRISETMNLRMKDIDMANCCITIRESKFYTSRVVTFNEDVKKLIERFFSWRKNNCKTSDEDTSLWIMRNGSSMRLNGINGIFKKNTHQGRH